MKSLNMLDDMLALGGEVLDTQLNLLPGQKARQAYIGPYFATGDELVFVSNLDALAGDLTKYGTNKITGDALTQSMDSAKYSDKQTLPPFGGLLISVPTFKAPGVTAGRTDWTAAGIMTGDLFCGALSRIVVVSHPAIGVVGIQQYFGSIPGTYLGTNGNLNEYSFPIPYNDPLVRVACIYRTGNNNDPALIAIRLVRASGEDSGWIGPEQLDANANPHLAIHEYKLATDNGWELLPIYCLDVLVYGAAVSQNPIGAVLTRHTNPFAVKIDLKPPKPTALTSAAGDEPVAAGLDDTLLEWEYDNQSDVSQTVSIADRATVIDSHSVTNTSEKAEEQRYSVSLTASMMAEGVFMSASADATSTTSIVNTKSETASITVSRESDFSFPLVVPKNTKLKATVSTIKTRENRDATITIEYRKVGSLEARTVTMNVQLTSVNTIGTTVKVESSSPPP